ncbi:TetR family transcriptional regulator [Actinomyces sp.]|uniref:TetR family transcriptional regulator n=1 Tax=Actinomyces sp. TaxID=29317 RepID=UPI0026DAA5DA|nr:TetR family transcriptional regulator [Actinomyces sp.]MDO4901120.1 TetR family transcriptional regulator [Actinomyces sp.]
MARPVKFSSDDILDAAARVVLARGQHTTVAEIAGEAGAPVGSVYLSLRLTRGVARHSLAAFRA